MHSSPNRCQTKFAMEYSNLIFVIQFFTLPASAPFEIKYTSPPGRKIYS